MTSRLVGTAALATLAGCGLLVSPLTLPLGGWGVLPLLATIGTVGGILLLWGRQPWRPPLGILITLSVLLGVCLGIATTVILLVIATENEWDGFTSLEISLTIVSAGLFAAVCGSIYKAKRRVAERVSRDSDRVE